MNDETNNLISMLNNISIELDVISNKHNVFRHNKTKLAYIKTILLVIAYLFINVIFLIYVENSPGSIIIGIFIGLISLYVFYFSIWDLDDPSVKCTSSEIKSRLHSVLTISQRIENKEDFILFLKPFNPVQRSNNNRLWEKTKYFSGSRKKRVAALKKIETEHEDAIANTLADTPTFSLDDLYPVDYNSNILCGKNWFDLFSLLSQHAKIIVMLIDEKNSDGLDKEINYISKNKLEDKVLLFRFRTQRSLPFTPRWEINTFRSDEIVELPNELRKLIAGFSQY